MTPRPCLAAVSTLVPLLIALSSWTFASPAAPPNDAARPTTSNTMTGGALPFLPEAQPPDIASEVGIAELPFLVTEPPADAPSEAREPAPITGSADAANPFAPLLSPQLPAPEVAEPVEEALPPTETVQEPAPEPTQEPTQEIVEVPVPSEPPDLSELVPVPAPRTPVTSATTQAGALPRRLDSRLNSATAPTDTPSLLSWGAGGSEGAQAGALAAVAALRTPAPGVGAPVAQRPTPNAPGLASTPTQTPPSDGASTAATQASAAPGGEGALSTPTPPRNLLSTPAPISLVRGPNGGGARGAENSVRRYLSERGVAFTAMSTGTGIFRTQESERPILLAVGETLPGSDVVLVELTQNGAAFAQGVRADVRHTLSLRP